MLTKEELRVKKYIEKYFVPAVHKVVSNSDPTMYLRSGGRCCRQIALLLKVYLTKKLPNYKWYAIENELTDGFMEDYHHAWVFGRNRDGGLDIVMDYGKLKNEYSFFIKQRGSAYPSVIILDGEEYELDYEIDEFGRKEIAIPRRELFTKKTISEFYEMVIEEVNIMMRGN